MKTCFLETIFPEQCNHYGTLIGGHALRLMDLAAFVAASRRARCDVVTAQVEGVAFLAPVRQGQVAEVEANVVEVGTRTLTVAVTLTAEDLKTGTRTLCHRGTFVFVAVDAQGKATELPRT